PAWQASATVSEGGRSSQLRRPRVRADRTRRVRDTEGPACRCSTTARSTARLTVRSRFAAAGLRRGRQREGDAVTAGRVEVDVSCERRTEGATRGRDVRHLQSETGETLTAALERLPEGGGLIAGGGRIGAHEPETHAARRDGCRGQTRLGIRRRPSQAELGGEKGRRTRRISAPGPHLAERETGEGARTRAGARMLARRGRGELDENARRALRMEEADHPRKARARRLVDQRQPRAARGGEFRRHVGRLEADVVEPLPAPGEELGDAAPRVDRLEQLDLAPPDRQKGGPHALVPDRRLLGDAEPERVLPEGEAV